MKCQNCQLARFKSNISHCLVPTALLYSSVCSSDNRSAENTACQTVNRLVTHVAIALSTFLHKTPAAENALSASTDDGGILSKYLYNYTV